MFLCYCFVVEHCTSSLFLAASCCLSLSHKYISCDPFQGRRILRKSHLMTDCVTAAWLGCPSSKDSFKHGSFHPQATEAPMGGSSSGQPMPRMHCMPAAFVKLLGKVLWAKSPVTLQYIKRRHTGAITWTNVASWTKYAKVAYYIRSYFRPNQFLAKSMLSWLSIWLVIGYTGLKI